MRSDRPSISRVAITILVLVLALSTLSEVVVSAQINGTGGIPRPRAPVDSVGLFSAMPTP